MMRLAARVLALFLVVFPAATLALGLGNVEVLTTLNEPLRAEIPVTGIKPGEIDAIDIRLGTDEQFRRAGIERPFHLTRLKFKVVPDGERKARIEVTTRESVTEPFLNFLVELNWPSGRMIREYTLLLDPPVYGAAISSSSKQSIARVESVPESSGAPAPRPLPEPKGLAATEPPPPRLVVPAPEPERPPAAPLPAPTPAASVAPSPPSDLAGTDRYGPVVANESLWSIATRVRPDEGVSIQRMMFAILEANREAFFLDNINSLKKGAVLRIPGREGIGPDDKALAMAEVRRHQVLWDEYRSQLAGAPTAMPEGAPASAPGVVQTNNLSVTDGSTDGENKSRLQLVAAGASQNAGAPGDLMNLAQLQQELNMALEEADSKQRESQELNERLSETERIINDLNRMLEFKDDEIARLQNQLRQQEGTPVPAPEPAAAVATPEPEPEPAPMAAVEPEAAVSAEPESAAEPEPQPAAAAVEPEPASDPKPSPVVQPPQPEPQQASFVDELLNTARGYVPSGVDPIVLAGGLGILLILGGGLALYRRRQTAEAGVEPEAIDFEDDQDAIAGSDGALFADEALPQDEDSAVLAADEETQPAGNDAATVESADDDPLSELNIYMAYEHFDQAEDLVRRAIADSPDRHDYRLKLLEVFYAAKNLPSFQQAARELRDTVGADSALIATAIGWWQDLAPGQDLFGASQPQTSETQSSGTTVEGIEDEVFDVTSGASGENEESAMDFDLGFDLSGAEEGEEDSQGSSADFDMESAESEEPIPAGAESSPDVNFDLSDLEGDFGDESAAASSGDLGLEAQRSGDAAAVNAESSGLDFEIAEAGEDAANSDELADSAFDMNLDLGLAEEEGNESETPAEEHGLDFDFDTTQGDAQQSGEDGSGGRLELQSLQETDTSAEADGDLTAVDDRLDHDAETEAALPPEVGAAGDDDLGLDFDIGDNLDDEKGDSDELDLAIGMDGDDSGEHPGLDFAIEGGTDEESPGPSASGGGMSSDVDFEIGGDDDGGRKMGIDTVFEGVFDESSAEAAADDADDDPLGIGGNSGELPRLDSDTEDAIDLTFLGDAADTDKGDVLADLEFGGENSDDNGDDDSDRTEYMLREVPLPRIGDTDVAAEAASGNGTGELDDIQTKLDLAEAYIEMGDSDGARGILGEVMSEGSQTQQDQAKDLMEKLG
jgi:pilus assembly protein FimV